MNILKQFFFNLRLRKSFGKYLTKNNINKMINSSQKIHEKEIIKCGYIIIDIIQNEIFENIISDIINYFYSKEKYYITIYGTIIEILIFNKSNYNKYYEINIEYIKNDTDNIPENIKKYIRGIYGITNAKIGNYGGEKLLAYIPLIDKYYEKIILINNLKYGEIENNDKK